jgi:hypothetical protein
VDRGLTFVSSTQHQVPDGVPIGQAAAALVAWTTRPDAQPTVCRARASNASSSADGAPMMSPAQTNRPDIAAVRAAAGAAG